MSLAYIHALTGIAGANISIGSRHDYGVDGTIQEVVPLNNKLVNSGICIDFQLKSTTNWINDNDCIAYDIDATAYNKIVIRDHNVTTCILILLCLPKQRADWLNSTDNELTLRNGCYWHKLSGSLIDNASTKRIRIPKKQLLTESQIRQLLIDERNCEAPK